MTVANLSTRIDEATTNLTAATSRAAIVPFSLHRYDRRCGPIFYWFDPRLVARRAWQGIKERARIQLHNAIRRGDSVKPKTCPACGHDGSRHRIEGHHADYFKPLEVEWLCQSCHMAKHGGRFGQHARSLPANVKLSVD